MYETDRKEKRFFKFTFRTFNTDEKDNNFYITMENCPQEDVILFKVTNQSFSTMHREWVYGAWDIEWDENVKHNYIMDQLKRVIETAYAKYISNMCGKDKANSIEINEETIAELPQVAYEFMSGDYLI